MQRQSSYLVSLFIFTTLIMVTTGFQLITLDVPKTHETLTFQKTVNFSGYSKQKVDLGFFPAWSSFTVSFESNVEVGVKIGASSSNSYPTTMSSPVYVHTVSYVNIADKSVSIFVNHQSSQNNIGSTNSPVVILDITISKASNYSTNEFIMAFIAFLSLLFIRRRNMNKWFDEEAKQLSSVEQLDAKRTYRMNNTWCDTCGRNFYGISDKIFSTKNCTFTCNLISLKRLLISTSVAFLVISWFSHSMYLLTILIFGITLYTLESDTNSYRYTMYPKRKQLLEEGSKEKIKVVNAIPTKYIPELDQEFLVCCYQSARLDELYCECGRIVPNELRQYLNLENLT